MGAKSQRNGWKISEVERLIGLSRRDIQRACYQGRGGVGILEPADSSWGRRLYSREDLAKLFVIKQYKTLGYSLPEIRVVFDKAQRGNGWQELLGIQACRLHEKSDEATEQFARAEALMHAVSPSPETEPSGEGASELISCMRRGLSPCSDEAQQTTQATLARHPELLEFLDSPGADLVIELQLGPGTADYLHEAIGSCGSQR